MTLENAIILMAFSRGWRALLREQRVTARNIETLASDLLMGILEAADEGEKNEIVLVARGIRTAAGPIACAAVTHTIPPQLTDGDWQHCRPAPREGNWSKTRA